MTDEQIEQALECCIGKDNNAVECLGCAKCPLFETKDCKTILIMEMRNQTNRLKAENAILKKNADEAFQQGLNENRKLIEPEIRKETAKEILQILFDEAMQYGKTTDGIKHMAQKYGVEVSK